MSIPLIGDLIRAGLWGALPSRVQNMTSVFPDTPVRHEDRSSRKGCMNCYAHTISVKLYEIILSAKASHPSTEMGEEILSDRGSRRDMRLIWSSLAHFLMTIVTRLLCVKV